MASARRGVSDNVYTVLMFATLVALGAGVGYVAYRSNQLFETYNPLDKGAELVGMILPMFGS
ncbi:hypothetical protein OT109_15950 [Phycisphaeraceae bacterium D3-23]